MSTDQLLSDLDKLVASVQTVPSMDANAAANNPPPPTDPLEGQVDMSLLQDPFPVMDNPDTDITEEEADTLQKIVVSYLAELDASVKKSDADSTAHCNLCETPTAALCARCP